jgi:hypothetical protein
MIRRFLKGLRKMLPERLLQRLDNCLAAADRIKAMQAALVAAEAKAEALETKLNELAGVLDPSANG